MTEVTTNSFGEEEAQKGAGMGLRPGRQQTLRRPQTHRWRLREYQGTWLCAAEPVSPSEEHQSGQDRQDMIQSRSWVKKGKNKKGLGHGVHRGERNGPGGEVRKEGYLTSLLS